MENTKATCSFSPSNIDGGGHRSHGLKMTLSAGSDENAKAVMALLEEDGDSSAHVPKICGSTKPQLSHMLVELRGSYRSSSAERHDMVFSESDHVLQPVADDPKSEIVRLHPESVVGDPYADSSHVNSEFMDKPADKTEVLDRQMADNVKAGDFQNVHSAWDYTLLEMKLQVAKLMEENLRQQAELIKRNDEKRAIIDRLQLQMECLKGENLALRNSVRCSSGNDRKHRKFEIPLLGRIFKKFLSRRLFMR